MVTSLVIKGGKAKHLLSVTAGLQVAPQPLHEAGSVAASLGVVGLHMDRPLQGQSLTSALPSKLLSRVLETHSHKVASSTVASREVCAGVPRCEASAQSEYPHDVVKALADKTKRGHQRALVE